MQSAKYQMPKLTRFPDWTDRLQTYLDRVRDDPFKWGEHDCVLFANGAVQTITGHDFVSEVAGTYGSLREAAQWLRSNGHTSLVDAVCSKLGEPIHPAQAGRGDIVMRRTGNGNALGVAVSHGFAWFVGEEIKTYVDGEPLTRRGLIFFPTLTCDRAWKIAPVEADHG